MEYFPASQIAITEAEKVAIAQREEMQVATAELQATMQSVPSVRWLHCSAPYFLELAYGFYRVSDAIAERYMVLLRMAVKRYAK